jgi:putative oxidoreductase
MNTLFRFLQPGNYSLSIMLLRVWTGAMMVYHGYPKLFEFMPKFIESVQAKTGLPGQFAWLAAISEFAGGICLVFGLFTRLSALGVFITMMVAAFVVHANDPWNKMEFALSYAVSALVLIIVGAGALGIDGLLIQRLGKKD